MIAPVSRGDDRREVDPASQDSALHENDDALDRAYQERDDWKLEAQRLREERDAALAWDERTRRAWDEEVNRRIAAESEVQRYREGLRAYMEDHRGIVGAPDCECRLCETARALLANSPSSFSGIPIEVDPDLPPGRIELRGPASPDGANTEAAPNEVPADWGALDEGDVISLRVFDPRWGWEREHRTVTRVFSDGSVSFLDRDTNREYTVERDDKDWLDRSPLFVSRGANTEGGEA